MVTLSRKPVRVPSSFFELFGPRDFTNLKSSERAFFDGLVSLLQFTRFLFIQHSNWPQQVLTLDHSRGVYNLEVAKGSCESNFQRYG